MLVLLQMRDGDIGRWLVAGDSHDMRRQIGSVWGNPDGLAAAFYAREFWARGKYDLGGGFVLLVS